MNNGILETTLGIIVRGDIRDINDMLDEIREFDGIDIVYQKASNDRLYVTEHMPLDHNCILED